MGLSFNPHQIKLQNTSAVFFTCAQILFLNTQCAPWCVCAYMHTVSVWNCSRNLVRVCSTRVPFNVCLLFVWLFSGYRNNLPWMLQCTRQSSSSKFDWFSCAVFSFVLPAAYFKLDMPNLPLFQVKILNFSSILKEVGKWHVPTVDFKYENTANSYHWQTSCIHRYNMNIIFLYFFVRCH